MTPSCGTTNSSGSRRSTSLRGQPPPVPGLLDGRAGLAIIYWLSRKLWRRTVAFFDLAQVFTNLRVLSQTYTDITDRYPHHSQGFTRCQCSSPLISNKHAPPIHLPTHTNTHTLAIKCVKVNLAQGPPPLALGLAGGRATIYWLAIRAFDSKTMAFEQGPNFLSFLIWICLVRIALAGRLFSARPLQNYGPSIGQISSTDTKILFIYMCTRCKFLCRVRAWSSFSFQARK